MCIMITGSIGFIGFHLAKRLLKDRVNFVGLDNINDYYDVSLKISRKKQLEKIANENEVKFNFVKASLEDRETLKSVFKKYKIKKVVNLAAQAGVRYSLQNPMAYINSNLVGFANLLEECRSNSVDNLIYASSSSVYGGNTNIPFNEKQCVDHPISLYAATKKSNELMAHSYSHLYGIPSTGLRFFTVYGPWGRPDMALFLFTSAIRKNKPIKVFNKGNMFRDFTYVDDIVNAVYKITKKVPKNSKTLAPYRVFNIGNNKPLNLKKYIKMIEKAVGKNGIKKYLPMQKGDLKYTHANISKIKSWINFKPKTNISTGINLFVKWHKEYYK